MDTLNLDFEINLLENVTWFYDQAVDFRKLVELKDAWYDQNGTQFWEGWYNSVFNLKTANQFGCVVWAIILNVPVELIYRPNTGIPWGVGKYRENFRYANFAPESEIPLLTLDEARRLLQMRYYAQTMSPSVGNINAALKAVFGDLGLSYIKEVSGGGAVAAPWGVGPYRNNFKGNFFGSNPLSLIIPMRQTYIFTFPLRSDFVDALTQYDILPRGAGVISTIETP